MKQADSIMLSGMIDCLSVAVENAVLVWGFSLNEFFDMFIKSTFADSFSKREPFVTTGCTGEELVALIHEKTKGEKAQIKEGNTSLGYSEYYWIGYAIALFSGMSDIGIEQIISKINPDEWLRLYSLLHEYGDDMLYDKLMEIYDK
ncbi:MAG: hypothetical protein LBM69_01745, partial [Lachnospiraceae bacterium]|jgi:hypothetical protein|nr:hypothetical protein [Lachnospiraceae bacterium]